MACRLFKARSLGENQSMLKVEGFSGRAHDLLSLVDAAALKVTGNLNLTLYALKVIPHHLYPVLLTASLKGVWLFLPKLLLGPGH